MPYIRFSTNREVTPPVRQALSRAFGEAIGCFAGKSERWLMTEICGGAAMTMAGTEEPCAMVGVALFGEPSDRECEAFTARVTKSLGELLSLPPARIYVSYRHTEQWGWNGADF